jgi:peptidoglycan/xylan/chitin deacetylase (PgdA/CDA1 family)
MTALMYHDIVSAGAEDTSGFPGRDAALYKLTPDAFAAHLDAVKRSVRTPSAAVFTFDDGGVSAMRAAEMLEARGFVGRFFVTANYIGAPGFVTARDLRELRQRGHVIGSHSCSHPLRMGHCSWTQLLDEWTASRAILSDILRDNVSVASVPGGDFAPAVARAAAKAGFTRLFTSEPTRREWTVDGLTIAGRYTIQRWTSPATAAALASGAWMPCARQAIVWNAKKLTKRIGGDRYLQVRRLLLRHGNEVRWGDLR